MASFLISKLLMPTSPFIQKGISSLFNKEVGLLTIQNYMSLYGKIGLAVSAAVTCVNFVGALKRCIYFTDDEFDRAYVHALPPEDGLDKNVPFHLSLATFFIFSALKGIVADSIWPLVLYRFFQDNYRRNLFPKLFNLGFSFRP
jgi:hypothetical protein